MKKFPTPFQIFKEIDKNYRDGLTLTQIVERTHPSFNIVEYRKDGHRALIRETLVKTGFVSELQFNKRTYKYMPTGKRISFINKVLRRVA
tara:strand:- start:362 stop:631 length:270 start_codon:yes stop_codon:yes gene_type:complete